MITFSKPDLMSFLLLHIAPGVLVRHLVLCRIVVVISILLLGGCADAEDGVVGGVEVAS